MPPPPRMFKLIWIELNSSCTHPLDIHGFHGYPWNLWISMDAMNIHGIHGYPRNPCISMDSMNFHGIHDIHGIHGYPWNQWISIESIDHQMPVHVNVGTCAQISGHMCPEIWAHVPKVCPEIWAHHQVSQIPKQKWAQYKLGYRVRTCTGPSGVLYGPVQYPAMGCKTASPDTW